MPHETCQFPNARILMFARAPVAGAVKTRLAPALGAEQACELHQKLVLKTLETLALARLAPLRLYCDDTANLQVQHWQGRYPELTLHEQSSGDLGERMLHAVRESIADTSAEQLLLLGSDCPFIDRRYLLSAFEALRCGSDVVFGPAQDGGYVMLALRQALPGLFAGIDWGSERVLAQSIDAALALGLRVDRLLPLPDIDRPEDLGLLQGVVLPDR